MALDEIGMRPVENGALMYRAGIPFEAALYALTMQCQEDDYEQLENEIENAVDSFKVV